MKTLSPDTHPEIERIWIEGIRKMTPAEKFARLEGLNAMGEQLARTDVLRRYPDATEDEVRLRIASRRIPAELMVKAFGWDPTEKGY
ncbi:MAG: hypothetical protein SFU56_14550 [Capsulimonadales bacterium]|nr:hypothetical protein [Capsulimonadales bacterium]